MQKQTDSKPVLIDRFGRAVSYLRLSVTDRCDFRCVYCMDEEMQFVPREQVLTLEELALISKAFVELGGRKVRITGGEPLVRQGVVELCQSISSIEGLDELVMTTNGSQLEKYAVPLRAAGVKRLNISLDSLNPERFKELTRTGSLEKVLRGIDCAREAGFERIKLNAVILQGRNADEVLDLVHFARDKGLDLSFIEEMPLGAITEHSRKETFVSSADLRDLIGTEFQLTATGEDAVTGGPSRYFRLAGSDSQIGFISPHSENFCSTCNRVRVTAEGRLLLCLGNEHSTDLRTVIRESGGDLEALKEHLVQAMNLKPEKHHFDLDEEPDVVRFMNATGG